jgi:hypothetical protein
MSGPAGNEAGGNKFVANLIGCGSLGASVAAIYQDIAELHVPVHSFVSAGPR